MKKWTPDETALDLLARRPTRGFRSGLGFLDACVAQAGGFRPRQVLQLDAPADAPSMLVLLHVVAAFLAKEDAEPAGRVVIMDHEHEADAELLLPIVALKLQSRVQDAAERETLARQLMENVLICHCSDTFQWLATLNHLHFELQDAPAAPLLLVINSVGSFYVIDKMVARSVGDGLAMTEQVFLFLQQFIRLHSPIVVAVHFSSRRGANMSSWEQSETLPTSWTSQVAKRIQLRVKSASTQRCPLFEARTVAHGESHYFTCWVDGVAIHERALTDPRVAK